MNRTHPAFHTVFSLLPVPLEYTENKFLGFSFSLPLLLSRLSSIEDIRLADGQSFKEVILFGLKFTALLIMALKTSCHKRKISQPPDIKNVNILFLIQLPAHEANRWAYYWVQGGGKTA